MFDKYTGQIESLLAVAKNTQPGHLGQVDLGEKGVLDFSETSSLTTIISSTNGIRFLRDTTGELRLVVLDTDSTPRLSVRHDGADVGFDGKLRSIEFIDDKPVMQFDELNCLSFK